LNHKRSFFCLEGLNFDYNEQPNLLKYPKDLSHASAPLTFKKMPLVMIDMDNRSFALSGRLGWLFFKISNKVERFERLQWRSSVIIL
jgi:hypothetical protein